MKFEYKILTISTAHLKKETFQAELITKFNELGSLGWELINAEGITEGSIVAIAQWRLSAKAEHFFFNELLVLELN
jgi:hypothetical protein